MNLIHHLHVARASGKLLASLALAPVSQRLHQARRHRMQADGRNRRPKLSSSCSPSWCSAACKLYGRRRRLMSTAHITTAHHERMAYTLSGIGCYVHLTASTHQG
jgi:hypothetical protein